MSRTKKKLLTEAKNSLLNNVAVSYNSYLDETIESKVIETTVETLKSGSNAYQRLATKIQNTLSIEFGENWSVVIGREDAFDFEHSSRKTPQSATSSRSTSDCNVATTAGTSIIEYS
jgi:hypothetical protein